MRVATILIVEDDPEIRQLVAELMRREGFEVEAVEDARGMNETFARRHRSICRSTRMIRK
jgi:DNA-binding response OmpR family regulator